METSTLKNWKRFLFGAIAVSIIIVINLLIYAYPYHPNTLQEWILFIIVGIPSYMFLEWGAEKIFSAKIFSEFSLKSFFAHLAIFLVFTIAVVLIGILFFKM